jgi:hypothetical protein
MLRSAILAAGSLLASGIGPAIVAADEFRLESGGCIRGEWLNRDQKPLLEYVVRTERGIVLRLATDQVREAISLSPALAEYRRREPNTPDTADAQWQLAEWCREQGLAKERQQHLARVLQLDENHQLARRAGGYHFINGQWVLPRELREAEGYVYYRGRWRTPQEVDSLEAQAKLSLAQKDWLNKLRRWRNDLHTERAKAAVEAFAAIRDPVAVKPLAQLLAGERIRLIKFSYCDILASINTAEATGVLVQTSLHDADMEMFHHCIDKLVELKPPHIVDPYVEALRDENNAKVKRAALALGRFKDRSTISPLIDALRTKHIQVQGSTSPFGNLDSQTFGKSSLDASGSFGSAGVSRGEGAKMVVVGVQNEEALEALTTITGTSFGYDQRAWHYWHAQEKRRTASQSTVNRRE